MSCTLLHLNIKLKWKMFIVALFVIGSLIMTFKVIQADTVIVHANVAWEMTDVVVQEKMTLSWKVEKVDLWSFNPQLFPEGHTADGIPRRGLKRLCVSWSTHW